VVTDLPLGETWSEKGKGFYWAARLLLDVKFSDHPRPSARERDDQALRAAQMGLFMLACEPPVAELAGWLGLSLRTAERALVLHHDSLELFLGMLPSRPRPIPRHLRKRACRS
jgi:hypothetical protein